MRGAAGFCTALIYSYTGLQYTTECYILVYQRVFGGRLVFKNFVVILKLLKQTMLDRGLLYRTQICQFTTTETNNLFQCH